VTIRLGALGIRAVLLDIEGTTTPIAFVHDVLFPFARARVGAWFTDADPSTRDDITRKLETEHAADGDAAGPLSSPVTYALSLMDRDRKSPALKELQGLIWESGYQAGLLHGVVFDDVPEAIERWRRDGYDVAIYSSGSELAQRRLFESIPQGDLTPQLSRFFDTRVGAKTDAASYGTIARRLGMRPDTILFISDAMVELEAADRAGCRAALSRRPGNAPVADTTRFPVITSFAEVV
jgi:enolase-phosphatase E1